MLCQRGIDNRLYYWQNAHGDYINNTGCGNTDDFLKVDLIRINRAAPVIGEVAMETVTETIITESTMIGHNPSTPGSPEYMSCLL